VLLEEQLIKTKFLAGGDVFTCFVLSTNSSASSICGEKGELDTRYLSIKVF